MVQSKAFLYPMVKISIQYQKDITLFVQIWDKWYYCKGGICVILLNIFIKDKWWSLDLYLHDKCKAKQDLSHFHKQCIIWKKTKFPFSLISNDKHRIFPYFQSGAGFVYYLYSVLAQHRGNSRVNNFFGHWLFKVDWINSWISWLKEYFSHENDFIFTAVLHSFNHSSLFFFPRKTQK